MGFVKCLLAKVIGERERQYVEAGYVNRREGFLINKEKENE